MNVTGEIDWRAAAVSLFNETWALIDIAERTPDQDREMLASALGSLACWRKVGTPKNFSISDWQVARVYALMGDAESASIHGESSLRHAIEGDLEPFYVGFAHEALARAAIVAADPSRARRHIASATAQAGKVSSAEDRAMLDADLAQLERLLPGHHRTPEH